MRLSFVFISAGLGGAIALIAACSPSSSAKSDRLCTPNNYVYCRCADLAEGTKQCSEDGASFSACDCGEAYSPPPDDGLGPTVLDPVESKVMPGAKIPAACIGKLGVVAGQESGSDAFVATYSESGKFTVSVSRGPGLRSPVSMATVGKSLVATYLSKYRLLAWTKFEQGSWSAPVSIGLATSVSKPSLVLAKAEPPELALFYLGVDGKYYTGKYASGWDDATTVAEAATGDSSSVPGKSAPSGAIANGLPAYAFSGSDGSANFATFDGTAWSPVQHVDVRAAAFAPTLIGINTATRDLLAVYTGADLALRSLAHDKVARTLEPPAVIDTAAIAQDPVQMATLADGRVLMVYRAVNGKPYYATYDGSIAKWSTPRELLAGKNPEIAWTPSVTVGRCGSDATVGYAETGGKVKIARFVNGTFEGPYDVDGIEKATYVGVAELP